MFHVEHDFTSIFKFSLLLVRLCSILKLISKMIFYDRFHVKSGLQRRLKIEMSQVALSRRSNLKKKEAEENSSASEMFHVEHELTLKFNFSK